MAYPKKLLSPGESIKFEMRPHWRAIIFPIIILIALVFFGAWLFFLTDGSILRWIVGLGGIAVLLFGVLIPFLRWITTQYVFTDRRIIVRQGLLTKEGRDVPLAKVNSVSFEKSVLGRIFNFGVLQIESANVDGTLSIKDVPDVEEIQRDIYRLQEEDDVRRRGGSHGNGTSPVLPTDGT